MSTTVRIAATARSQTSTYSPVERGPGGLLSSEEQNTIGRQQKEQSNIGADLDNRAFETLIDAACQDP